MENPDEFTPTSIVLEEITGATHLWDHYVPDMLVPIAEWTLMAIEYTAPSDGLPWLPE